MEATVPVGWTDERTKLLTERWESGMSAALIAAELNTTRNSIIGKVHRLGLPCRVVERAKKRTPKTARRNDGGFWARLDSIMRGAADSALDLPPDSSDCAKTIYDLISDRSQCRYPVTTPAGEPQLFCAAPVFEDKPYCGRHCALAYKPATQTSLGVAA